MREQRFAGQYYSGAPTTLDKQIINAFNHKKGPGDLPLAVSETQNDIQGLIVPFYDYDLAGPCAAWAYKDAAENIQPDVVIIIGHSSKDYSGITTEPYETPYGIVRVDQVFARALIQREHIKEHKALFDEDPFVEAQLPFVQFTFKKTERLKILPILLSSDIKFKELAVDIKEILMEQNKKALIIAPTNFTSYGPNYSYVPFTSDILKRVLELDEGAIDLIKENDVHNFLGYVDEHSMNMDNYLGIVLMMLILKPKQVLLEQYYSTAELNEDQKNFITFASIILKK